MRRVLACCAAMGSALVMSSSCGCACSSGACPVSESATGASPAMFAMAADGLPSWNDSASKAALVGFVERVTTPGGPEFVKSSERIAVFDNDGTLWAEQPMYFQVMFVMDRVKALAPQHPEYKTLQPFKAVLENDMATVAASGQEGLMNMLIATHSGMTTEQFSEIVRQWIDTAKHPLHKRPYTDLAYQPMLEVLDYLRASGFKTFIVSGGGIEFMRVFAEEVYGVPPEQVVGSSIKTEFVMIDGKPALMRQPELNFIDDGPGKPLGIHEHIGRRPIAAFGNSDGDLQMLQWTAAGDGARFCAIVHHDDAAREWAYDRQSKIGKLDKALDAATSAKWTVVSMKDDWRTVFPAQQAEAGSAVKE